MIDPIVAEVRSTRRIRTPVQLRFTRDVRCILRREEKLSGGGPLVSFPKKPVRMFPIKRTMEPILCPQSP